MMPFEVADAMADAMELEMRRIGLWSDRPPSDAALQSTEAFAADTLRFHQWLQFIFLPRVRVIVANRGRFPTNSSLAVRAVQELDELPGAKRLLALLGSFDEKINTGP